MKFYSDKPYLYLHEKHVSALCRFPDHTCGSVSHLSSYSKASSRDSMLILNLQKDFGASAQDPTS